MVGAVRFELTTSCTRNTRASQATLRPEPRLATCRLRRKIAISFLGKMSGSVQKEQSPFIVTAFSARIDYNSIVELL